MRNHLNVAANYKGLGNLDKAQLVHYIKVAIAQWLNVHTDSFSKLEKKYLKQHLNQNKSPFGWFYLLRKAQKKKPDEPIPSRPIVSCPGSLLHSVGIFVEDKLKLVAQRQQFHIKSSLTLKKQLHQLYIPPFGVILFSADAVAMHNNIPTDRALWEISQYMHDNSEAYPDLPIEATLAGLELVMKYNILTFGGMCFLQLKGTAMVPHQHPRLQPFTRPSRKHSSSPNSNSVSCTTGDIWTMYLAYGDIVLTQQLMPLNGSSSSMLWTATLAWPGNSVTCPTVVTSWTSPLCWTKEL
jgi:hypothetical protein